MELPALSKNKRRVAYWLSLGAAPSVIAGKVGLTLQTVLAYSKMPVVQQYSEMVRSGELEELAEVQATQQILDKAAPRAAERITELMETAVKDETRLKAAENILDRTGHAKQSEVKHTTILIDIETARLIEETKRMMAPIVEAEFELIPEIEDDGHHRETVQGSHRTDGRDEPGRDNGHRDEDDVREPGSSGDSSGRESEGISRVPRLDGSAGEPDRDTSEPRDDSPNSGVRASGGEDLWAPRVPEGAATSSEPTPKLHDGAAGEGAGTGEDSSTG